MQDADGALLRPVVDSLWNLTFNAKASALFFAFDDVGRVVVHESGLEALPLLGCFTRCREYLIIQL